MSTLNDDAKLIVGGPNLNDNMKEYMGGLNSGATLNGDTLKALQSRGATSTNLNTAWAQYLAITFALFQGTLQDKQKQFWEQGGFLAISNIDINQMVVWLQSEGWNASNQGGTHLHVADTGESWHQADLNTCNVISAIPALQVDLHQGIEMQGGTCA